MVWETSGLADIKEVRVPAVVRVRNKVKAPTGTKGCATSYPTEFEALRPSRSRTGCYGQGQGIATSSTVEALAPNVAERTNLPHKKVGAPEEVKNLAAINPTETKLLLPTRSSSAGDHQGQGYSAAATEAKVSAAFRVENEVKVPYRAKDPIISYLTDFEVLRSPR